MAASRPLLRMEGIRKRFGATLALDGVDLQVAPGQVLALVGENGAGKSTLMKVLSGAHAPDEGRMWLDDRPCAPANPLAARRAGISMIYQELSLAPHLTVMENILLGMEPATGPFLQWKKMAALAAGAMARLGRPDILPDTPVHRLPIAARQMVEIARAIAVGSRVLVLDEPTSSLAARDIEHLFTLIRTLRERGLAIIYISHFLEEIRAVCDRFTVLRDGRTVGSGEVRTVTDRDVISLMVGRSVEDLYPRSPRSHGAPVLELTGLSGVLKPREVSLTLHRGEVFGIAGLIGAGRTELLRALFGLDPIVSGKIRLGAFSGPATPARHWQEGMGMVSEDRKTEGLALSLGLADNITLSRLPFFVSPASQARRAAHWVERVGIRCRDPRQPVGDLSGGNQQKVALARLLEHDVDVLLLDEPTRGIDVGSKAQIYRLIDELACSGKAILMVSSYLPELMGVCDRIAVMARGRLHPARPVGQITEQQIMEEATALREAA